MAKVSVCIPAYRQVEFLRKTLASVAMQDLEDYELIVSDDSPDDAVRKLLDTFSFGEKLRYFHHSPALGSPANWNYAMEQATGEYVKILHHDDFFTSPQSLGKFVKLLDEMPEASFAFSGTEVDLLQYKMKKLHFCSAKQFRKMDASPDVLFFSNYIGAPSATIVRNKTGILFDPKLKWLVDVDWYMQHLQNSRAAYTREPLICTVHGGEGQITQSVIADRTIQVREHVYLYEKLEAKKISNAQYSLFFQLLFNKYNMETIADLRKICTVDASSVSFFEEALRKKKRAPFLKKVIYWLKKKSLKDHLFTLKTRFR
jgi:glycosyltransferase involved in cell wall biosynthesis